METIHIEKTIEQDGELLLTGLPYRKGQRLELTLHITPVTRGKVRRAHSTARQLLDSGLIGLWKERTDIGDSVTFARQLRERAQRRG
jgi:hypothetical protein